ncbi:acyl-CoA dehydrogenase family protein [Geodermatophilus sabuli]|uniref:Acyl-CoA dehydrogenase n=1 Tax=Geodermatophilus sabuli TaxID=1564158 RepID=A0A285EAM3_9ACTN|nr:acyl-CoA dehydrogenase family protein [Geodermatophilus sabuli]MBB3085548.1 acyl-CoA dehydrogenase [Geodermatophilus sabuli]SNX96030.1 acyl-CoA dehydrogenase [Geodermatophilus sabuli]
MSDITEALTQAVADACGRHPSSAGASGTVEWNVPLWSALDQIGITLLSVPEDRGGSDGDLVTAAAVLEILGEHSATVPFAETAMLAGWLLAECSAPIPAGPMTAAVAGPDVTLVEDAGGWVLNGELARVPWGRHADHLVLLVGRHVVTVHRDEVDLRPGANLAGEPRDDVALHRLAVPADRVHPLPADSAVDARLFAARGVVGRLAMMAGAARRSLEMSLAYASERHQFGRPIGGFQSVQQQVAAMAAEVLLCKVAAQSAAQALDSGADWELAVAAAKVSAGSAAGTVARIAHQVHGAIGFTDEHDLRRSTTRIWSWRDEFGSVGEWARELGTLAAAAGADGLWPLLTEGGARAVAG